MSERIIKIRKTKRTENRQTVNFPPRLDIPDDCKCSQWTVTVSGSGTHDKIVSNNWGMELPRTWALRPTPPAPSKPPASGYRTKGG